jgi:K+/H+ antiporter YhaU regulatory subunit KhtT
MIADIIDPAASGKSVHDELAKFIRDEYPWEAETADFMIPLSDSALNLKLSELRLRSETGATIVAIYRDTESIANPSADMALAPGDVLLVLGNKAQIQSALAFLQKKAKEPLSAKASAEKLPKTLPFTVTADLACVGKSMEELKLKRRSGATILGIQKYDQVIHNPTGGMVTEEGDILMLFGWPEQLEAASVYLSTK